MVRRTVAAVAANTALYLYNALSCTVARQTFLFKIDCRATVRYCLVLGLFSFCISSTRRGVLPGPTAGLPAT
ncbi:hypothetical protein BCV70DRAFT_126676 [Testicularia cyperi]|uniref:Uncharacterized protein n=1 Tax=Testicularia cyperi TaxID=1882483 RepID=A0A317XN45_9BASI|nr:hypothetical protein BCV70DRAFT_126676 [Testicularia cyperi]